MTPTCEPQKLFIYSPKTQLQRNKEGRYPFGLRGTKNANTTRDYKRSKNILYKKKTNTNNNIKIRMSNRIEAWIRKVMWEISNTWALSVSVRKFGCLYLRCPPGCSCSLFSFLPSSKGTPDINSFFSTTAPTRQPGLVRWGRLARSLNLTEKCLPTLLAYPHITAADRELTSPVFYFTPTLPIFRLSLF